MLLTNPSTMNKLITGIEEPSASSFDIYMERAAKLPYLNAYITETMRLYPSTPGGLLYLTPAEDSTICGHSVPPDVTVSATHLLPMYTSPKNFKHPLSFISKCWIDDEWFSEDKRAAVQPFSVGSRNCLGKGCVYLFKSITTANKQCSMTNQEMRLILAKML
jgi:cytochrome P450